MNLCSTWGMDLIQVFANENKDVMDSKKEKMSWKI